MDGTIEKEIITRTGSVAAALKVVDKVWRSTVINTYYSNYL